MKDSDKALKPNYFKPLQQLRDMPEEKIEEEIIIREESLLAGLANNEAWEVLKKHIESEIDKLNNLNRIQIEAGASFDEIGKNAVLVQLCKEELQSIINKVEDAREPGDTRKR